MYIWDDVNNKIKIKFAYTCMRNYMNENASYCYLFMWCCVGILLCLMYNKSGNNTLKMLIASSFFCVILRGYPNRVMLPTVFSISSLIYVQLKKLPLHLHLTSCEAYWLCYWKYLKINFFTKCIILIFWKLWNVVPYYIPSQVFILLRRKQSTYTRK